MSDFLMNRLRAKSELAQSEVPELSQEKPIQAVPQPSHGDYTRPLPQIPTQNNFYNEPEKSLHQFQGDDSLPTIPSSPTPSSGITSFHDEAEPMPTLERVSLGGGGRPQLIRREVPQQQTYQEPSNDQPFFNAQQQKVEDRVPQLSQEQEVVQVPSVPSYSPVTAEHEENQVTESVQRIEQPSIVEDNRPKISHHRDQGELPVLPQQEPQEIIGKQQGVFREASESFEAQRQKSYAEKYYYDDLLTHVDHFDEIDQHVRSTITQEFGKSNAKVDTNALSEAKKQEHKNLVTDFIVKSAKSKARSIQINFPDPLLNFYADYVYKDVFQLGVLQDDLDDESVTEIMVSSPSKIFVERNGKITKVFYSFRSNEHLKETIDRIINPLGRSLSELEPNVDGRLPDRSRISATMQGIAVNGYTLTIRKFPKKQLNGDFLLSVRSLSDEMLIFLKSVVRSHLNMFISGGTGSGKTVTLNILSNYISENDRVITIEDSIELNLAHDHVEAYEARPGNFDGKGRITIRDILKWTLRKRPDCIVIGECRGEEALDMLQALNTGHYGYSTGHANSPEELISRLSTMVWQAGVSWSEIAVLRQITSAIQIIAQVSRLSDGTRKMVRISEIAGLGEEGAKRLGIEHNPNLGENHVYMHDIFRFQERGKDADGKIYGEYIRCDRPIHFEELQRRGGLPDLWA